MIDMNQLCHIHQHKIESAPPLETFIKEVHNCPVCQSNMPYHPLAIQEAQARRESFATTLTALAQDTVKEFNENGTLCGGQMFCLDQEMDMKSMLGIAEFVRHSQLVFWRHDLWMAATQGCEVFVNTYADPNLLVPPVQFFLPDKDFFFDEDGCKYLNLPNDVNVMLGLLLILHRRYKVVDGKTNSSGPFSRGISTAMLIGPSEFNLQGTHTNWRSDWFIRVRMGFLNEDEPITDPNFARIISLLEFMRQPITSVETHRPPRAERRRMEREHKKIPETRVITLRRVKHAKHSDGSPVDWSCQWVVSGHWRNQWHPSTQTHKPTYIASYVKGPEGKPLKSPSKSIYVVSR